METRTKRNPPRRFGHAARHFVGLAPSTIAALAAGGADVVLILSREGLILDVAFNDLALSAYGLGQWPGEAWTETVTVESTDKILEMLEQATSEGESRPRQVNHPAKGQTDLPVNYRVLAVPGAEWLIAYGQDLRNVAELQQQLLQAQMELDREYRRIRETETRYRSAFQKLPSGIMIISADTQKILDMNAGAAEMFGESPGRLVGQRLKAVIPQGSRPQVASAIATASETGLPQTVQLVATSEASLELRFQAFRDSGSVSCLVHIMPAGGREEPLGRHDVAIGFAALPEALVTVDVAGVILDVNDEFLDLIHSLNRKSVLGRNIANWIGQTSIEPQLLVARANQDGQVRGFVSTLRDEMGRQFPIRISAGRTRQNGDGPVTLLIAERRSGENQVTVSAGGGASASSDFSDLVGHVPLKELIREAADVIEKLCIEAALRQTENNRASAAEMLGLSRQSLYIKLKRYGLESFEG